MCVQGEPEPDGHFAMLTRTPVAKGGWFGYQSGSRNLVVLEWAYSRLGSPPV
jgi:hypothetical protein